MSGTYDLSSELVAGLDEAGALLVRAAWCLAQAAHEGQVRNDGVRVIDHVEGVARNLLRFGPADAELRAAATLHDVVENTSVPLEEIEARFGPRVARLVDAVTNRPGEDAEAAALRARDVGADALLLRLCDRLDGVRRSIGRPPEKRAKFLAASRRVHLALAREHFPELAAALAEALEAAERRE
jgi:GTP pyrophosphokinase